MCLTLCDGSNGHVKFSNLLKRTVSMPRTPTQSGRFGSTHSAESQKRSEALIKLAEYHRSAMESRRTVGFRGLIAVLALNGTVLLKLPDILTYGPDPLYMKVILTTFSLCILIAFAHTLVTIEKRNEGDRRRYIALESQAWKILDPQRWNFFYADFAKEGSDHVPTRTFREHVDAAWAFSGAAVTSVLLFVIVIQQIWATR
jgi:hypothetical protein